MALQNFDCLVELIVDRIFRLGFVVVLRSCGSIFIVGTG